jgi:hypothetical protein
MHTLSADLSVHESCKHLGMAHFYCEAFAIAHNNVYEVDKKKKKKQNLGNPLMASLLKPHITSLIALNVSARVTLSINNDTNALDPFLSLSGREFVECMKH